MKFIVAILAIAIQSTVMYYYFNYFGVTWQSVIPFFIGLQYLKSFVNWDYIKTINKN